ncbi:MAG: YegP family protein [Sphingobacterium composti]|uniref:YegP family protein n=1 Tax=Sphingobacterium composti TaxID=363260 RepID=UPI00135C6E40|nr:YegP family protein [Sphingobacterium composti Ten et al. 2007 non Yoo et al. 2007]
MGKFEIKKRSNGEYQFNLKAGNGQVILSSEGYSSKANCVNGIESVKKNSQIEDRFERKASANNKYFFNLKASNGQTIGSSEMYESASGRDNGIKSVMENAPEASIVDLDA